ncbi:hypothetical protein WP1_260 [Pseudomonas phage WP1]
MAVTYNQYIRLHENAAYSADGALIGAVEPETRFRTDRRAPADVKSNARQVRSCRMVFNRSIS